MYISVLMAVYLFDPRAQGAFAVRAGARGLPGGGGYVYMCMYIYIYIYI